jgi:hypothetical protein
MSSTPVLLVMSCSVTGTRSGILVEDTPDTTIQDKIADAFSLNSVINYHERDGVGAAIVDYQRDLYNQHSLALGTVLVYRTHCRPEEVGVEFSLE